jgi:hypothetical protein
MKFTVAGILFMVVAWGIVIGLTVFSFAKVLLQKPKKEGKDS